MSVKIILGCVLLKVRFPVNVPPAKGNLLVIDESEDVINPAPLVIALLF